MKAVLGLDTSCYTTSCALVSLSGEILGQSRKLLQVPLGHRGLMQSEALFQHVSALYDRMAGTLGKDAEVVAVAASTRPRPIEDSYMPVFKAGESQARTAALLLGVPFYPFSHQEGHIRAALVDTKIDREKPFLALHLSGGTTEMLLCEGEKLTLLGGTRDLHAGQLVDRIGVLLGLPFPSGPALEELALKGQSRHLLPASVHGMDCSISGAETRLRQAIQTGLGQADAAAEVYDFLVRTIARMLENAGRETCAGQALLAGGVASSLLFRQLLSERGRKLRLPLALNFARPELSGDNAVGIALLGAEHYKETL